ncbi:hypothetical protein [Lacunimicrobium album]
MSVSQLVTAAPNGAALLHAQSRDMSMECHTLIILGAGASMPYGFPSGEKLVQSIASISSEEVTAASYIDRNVFTVSGLEEFKKRLRNSGYDSIDAFVEQNREFEKLGKFIVYKIIRKFEYKSTSLFERGGIENDWYRYILNNFLDNSGNELDSGIRILTFNYDRSLEYYLYNSLLNRRRISEFEAGAIVKHLGIHHLRGWLGPIQNYDEDAHKHVYYGKSRYLRDHGLPPEHDEAIQNFNSIEFVGLSMVGALPQDVQDWIAFASNVVFLGFGYHKSNMGIFRKIFSSSPKDGLDRRVRGTCLGFEPAEILTLQNRYQGLELFSCDSLSFLRKEGLFSPIAKSKPVSRRGRISAK